MTQVILHDGRTLNTHSPEQCGLKDYCCIHNPSDHPLKDAPFEWLDEIKAIYRVCEHGVLHPDPDSLRFRMAVGDFSMVEAISSVHLVEENCDGCCHD